MDEDVLVLRLDHVVALRSEARHVTVDVEHVVVLESVEHCVDDNERSGPADTSAAGE